MDKAAVVIPSPASASGESTEGNKVTAELHSLNRNMAQFDNDEDPDYKLVAKTILELAKVKQSQDNESVCVPLGFKARWRC